MHRNFSGRYACLYNHKKQKRHNKPPQFHKEAAVKPKKNAVKIFFAPKQTKPNILIPAIPEPTAQQQSNAIPKQKNINKIFIVIFTASLLIQNFIFFMYVISINGIIVLAPDIPFRVLLITSVVISASTSVLIVCLYNKGYFPNGFKNFLNSSISYSVSIIIFEIIMFFAGAVLVVGELSLLGYFIYLLMIPPFISAAATIFTGLQIALYIPISKRLKTIFKRK